MIDQREEVFLRKVHPNTAVVGIILEAFAEYQSRWLNEDSIVQIARLPSTTFANSKLALADGQPVLQITAL